MPHNIDGEMLTLLFHFLKYCQLGQLSLSSFRGRYMSIRPVYRMCAQVAPSGECLQGKGPPDRIVGKTLAPSVSGSLYPLGPGCCCCPA